MATAPSAGQTETLNGVRIYFETYGTGEPLLLFHGFSGSGRDWLPLLKGGAQTSRSSCRTCADTRGRAGRQRQAPSRRKSCGTSSLHQAVDFNPVRKPADPVAIIALGSL